MKWIRVSSWKRLLWICIWIQEFVYETLAPSTNSETDTYWTVFRRGSVLIFLLRLMNVELFNLIVDLFIENILPERYLRPNSMTLNMMGHIGEVSHATKLLKYGSKISIEVWLGKLIQSEIFQSLHSFSNHQDSFITEASKHCWYTQKFNFQSNIS